MLSTYSMRQVFYKWFHLCVALRSLQFTLSAIFSQQFTLSTMASSTYTLHWKTLPGVFIGLTKGPHRAPLIVLPANQFPSECRPLTNGWRTTRNWDFPHDDFMESTAQHGLAPSQNCVHRPRVRVQPGQANLPCSKKADREALLGTTCLLC